MSVYCHYFQLTFYTQFFIRTYSYLDAQILTIYDVQAYHSTIDQMEFKSYQN
ncbi:hypothetical protein SPPR111872_20355 [Sphingobacterium prati]